MEMYLQEIRHAVDQLIPLVWEERDVLRALEQELTTLAGLAKEEFNRADTMAMNAEDAEDVADATGARWDTYFGPERERFHKNREIDPVAQRVGAHDFSVAALAGALLQYGKQGISIVHGALAPAPPGRAFGSQTLKNVIWQARNQSLHWEEQAFRKPVEDCFDGLATEIDPKFGDFRKRNMSIDVVELLDWRDFDAFAGDLSTLG